MKQCKKCGEEKDLSAFHKKITAKDGLASNCKSCRAVTNRAYYLKDEEGNRAKRRERSRSPESKARVRTWRKCHKDKTNAQAAVCREIARGRRAPASACQCTDCQKVPAQHLHHHSYEREHWLDVVPLCASCHRIRHAYPERF